MERRSSLRVLVLAALLLPGIALFPGGVSAGTTPDADSGDALSDLLEVPPPAAAGPARDPFQPSVTAPSIPPPPPPPSPAQELLETLRVTAILSGSGRSAAMINGHIVRQGDLFKGMKVIRITRNEVWLEVEDKIVSLMLKENLYTPPFGEGE